MADEFRLGKPKPIEQPVQIVIEGAESITKTIHGMLRGDNYQDYLKNQKSLLDDVVRLTREYKSAMSSGDTSALETSGKELIKTVNALKTISGDDLSGVIKSYDKLLPTIQKAFSAFPDTDRIFSPKVFADAATALSLLRKEGVDLEQFFDRFGENANLDRLKEKNALLEGSIARVKAQYQEMAAARQKAEEELSGIKSGSAYEKLEEELEERNQELESIRDDFVRKFQGFLIGSGFSDFQWTGEFDDYIEKIKDGAMNADEAIIALKNDYRYMFQDSGLSAGDIAMKMDELSNIVTETAEKIDELNAKVRGTIEGSFVESVRQDMIATGDATGEVTQRLEAIQPGELQNILELLIEISKAGEPAEGSVKNVQSAATGMLEALSTLAKIDVGNLDSVDNIFRHLQRLDGAKFSEKQFENLRVSLDALSRIPKLEGLMTLSSINLSGFKDVKISKTIEHLANNLPVLAAAKNLSKLSVLSDVNLSGFNDLKVSKTIEYLGTNLPLIANAKLGNLVKLKDVDLSKFNGLTINKDSVQNLKDLTDALKQYADSLRTVASASKAAQPKPAAAATTGQTAGAATGGADPASINTDAQRATVSVGELKVAMESLRTVKSSLKKDTDKLVNGEQLEEEKQRIQEIEQLYTEFATKVYNFDGKGMTPDELNASVTAMKEEAGQIREKIDLLKQERKSRAEIAAEVDKMIKAAEKDSGSSQKQNKSLLSTQTLLKQITKLYGEVSNEKDRYEQSGKAVDEANVAALDSYMQKLEELRQKLKDGDIAAEEAKKQFSELSKQFADTKTQTGGAGKGFLGLKGNLADLTKSFAAMFSASRIAMMVIREIKQLAKEAVEIDTKMNQLRIVTRATDEEVKRFGDSVSASAKEIGSSISDLVDSATVYARLGYSMGESEQLAKYTSMLTKVGGIDVGASQDAITAIIKAYKDLDAADIESILNKMVTVGNNFPISVEQIAAGMNNAASSLAAAGNTFEESVALLTAANTVVQNASKAATGLRTITARLRNTTTDLEELGEDMTEAKYEEVIQALTKFKVSLLDVNGQYRSTYEIMKDIADQWDDMTSMEQSALAVAISGTRQQQIFYSIVDQFQEASSAMDQMADSEGALEEAYSVRMESIQAHLDQMKASVQDIGRSTVTADFANTFIDMGIGILSVIKGVTDLINLFGGLKNILLIVGSIFLTLKIDAILRAAKVAVYGLMVSFKNLGDTAAAAGAKIAAMSTAQKMMGGITAAIVVATLAITAYNNKLAETKQRYDEAIASGSNAAKEAKSLSDTYAAYLEAQSAYDQNLISKQELTKATEDLAEALNAEGDAAAKARDELKGLTLTELGKKLNEVQNGLEAAGLGIVDAVERRPAKIVDRVGGTLEQYLEKIGAAYRDSETGFMFNPTFEQSDKIDAMLRAYDRMQKRLSEIRNLTNGMTKDTDLYRDEYDDLRNAISEVEPYVKSLNDLEQDRARITSEIAKLENDMTGSNNAAAQSTADLAKSVDLLSQAYQQGASVAEQFKDAIDDTQKNITSLSSALEKLQSGELTLSDVVDLIQEFPELAKYIDATADGFGDLETGLKRLIRQSPKDLVKNLRDLATTAELTNDQRYEIDQLAEALSRMPDESIQSLSEEFGVLAEAINASKEELTELDKILGGDDYDTAYLKRSEQFERMKQLYEEGAFGSRHLAALQEAFGVSGMNVEDLGKWIKEYDGFFEEGTKGLQKFTDKVKELNETPNEFLQGVGVLDKSIASWDGSEFYYDPARLDEFAEAMQMDKDVLVDFIQAIQKYSVDSKRDIESTLNELKEANLLDDDEAGGLVGSTERVASFLNKSVDEVQDLVNEMNGLDGVNITLLDDTALRNLETIVDGTEDLEAAGKKAEEALEQIGFTMEDVRDPKAFKKVEDALRDTFGWTDRQIQALWDKLHASGAEIASIEILDGDTIRDVKAKFDELGIYLAETWSTGADKGFAVSAETINDMLAKGFSDAKISELLQAAADKGIEVPTELEPKNGESYQEMLDRMADEEPVTITVNMTANGEQFEAEIQTTVASAKEIIGDDWEVVLTGDTSDASKKISAIQSLKDNVEKAAVVSVKPDNSSFKTTEDYLDSIISKVDTLSVKISRLNQSRGAVSPTTLVEPAKNARGTRHAKHGPSLLGDEYSPTGTPKPELVVSDGEAYLAGVNGPVVADLKEGDVVYNNRDTKKILGRTGIKGSIPAFQNGIHNKVDWDLSPGGSSGSSKDKTGSTSSGYAKEAQAAKESAEKTKSAFEEAYEYHQHLLAMDQETVRAYLDWLIVAYQEAYSKQEITLEDFRKYEEEVYAKTKELFEDWLSDIEHQITVLSHAMPQKRDINQIVALYRSLMEAVHKEAEAARARGMTNDDEYIQNLQDKWYEYRDAIADARTEWYNGILDDQKFAIESMVDIGTDATKVVDEWRKVLAGIDAELRWYLDNGYKITDEAVQNLISEAREARDSIISTVNDVVDGIQNVYSTLTDAAVEWAKTGYLSVDSLQSILELGPKYLAFLYDENGQLVVNEASLQKVLKARTEELAVENALVYAKEVLQAAQLNDTEAMKALTQVMAGYAAETWDTVYGTIALAKAIGKSNGMSDKFFDDALDYINKMRALSQTAVNTISDYYHTLDEGYVTQAEGLEQIISLTKELLKYENQKAVDALNEQIKKYKEIVDAKKESLRLSKEQDDHDKSVSEKLEEISKLQAKIDQLALDSSREAQAQRLKLEEELAKQQADLADSQRDYAYDKQTEALDKDYEAFEKEKSAEIETLEKMYSSEEKLHRAALERIQNGWSYLYEGLISWNTEYGNQLNETITAAWEQAAAAVERYGGLLEAIEGVKSHIHLGPDADYEAGLIDRMRANSLKWMTSDEAGRAQLSAQNKSLAEEYYRITGQQLRYVNGKWTREDGSELYSLSKEDIVNAIIDAMKQNSEKWRYGSKDEKEALDKLNLLLGDRLANILPGDVHRTNGVWYYGQNRLYDYTFPNVSAVKTPPVNAKPISDLGGFEPVGIGEILSGKLGPLLSLSGGNVERVSPSPTIYTPEVRGGDNNNINFSPTIHIEVSHEGILDANAADKFGALAANATLTRLKDAFSRRGVGTINGVLVRQ